jgi:hypothetical protein
MNHELMNITVKITAIIVGASFFGLACGEQSDFAIGNRNEKPADKPSDMNAQKTNVKPIAVAEKANVKPEEENRPTVIEESEAVTDELREVVRTNTRFAFDFYG